MLADVQSKLAKATKRADRNANEVSLIAVSKQQPEARIDSALEATRLRKKTSRGEKKRQGKRQT